MPRRTPPEAPRQGSFRQASAWLHTWSGLVIGWVLYTIFLTGTAAFFQDEITVWMTPELGRQADPQTAIERAVERLQQAAPDAERWTIIAPDDRDPALRITWRPGRSGDEGSAENPRQILDARTGEPVQVRETRGGDLFYRLHYRFEIQGRNGWWFSGAAAMVMLIALVSGVIIHRKIFKDFFTFRRRSTRQRAWLDAHNFLAVLALPFHFVITYTGLVPIMSTVMPWPVIANYAEERTTYEAISRFDDLRSAYGADRRAPSLHADRPLGSRSALTPIAPVLRQAHEEFGDGRIGRVIVSHPGDEAAVIEVVRHVGDQISNRPDRLFFDGTSGAFLGVTGEEGAIATTRAVLYGLHLGRFADPVLRWLLFLLGLASTLMIAAGLILWTEKRRAQLKVGAKMPRGLALVERLNVGTLVGLPIAIAAFFWSNRLLSLDVAGRADLETQAFFGVWLVALGWAAFRPLPKAWIELSAVAACAFGALPLLNAWTTERSLVVSMLGGDWIMAGFDLTMLATGLLFAWIAWKGPRRRLSAAASTATHRAGTMTTESA